MTEERTPFPHGLVTATQDAEGVHVFVCRCLTPVSGDTYSATSDAFTAHLLAAYGVPVPPPY